uniref:Uncharacterized protein n=1 Tax=Florenciella sp. virus SA2 TaxID=3240092 RepID=A0AB39J9M1_9VIRU
MKFDLKKLIDHKRKITLSSSSLSTFYNKLNKAESNWNKINESLSNTELIYTTDNNLLHLSNDNGRYMKEVNPFIYENITSIGFYYKCVNVVINSKDYNIYFILPNSKNNISSEKVDTFFNICLKKIYMWLFFINDHIRKDCGNKTNIHFIFTNVKKNINWNSNEIIAPININTAFTTCCQKNVDMNIHIYRVEEWFKVFIHETFHCFGLDFSSMNENIFENKISQIFKVITENGSRIYESYCELWAQSLNVVFCSFYKSNTQKQFVKQFNYYINKELSFSLLQLTKLCNHYNIKYTDLIDINCKTIMFKEKSHVLSYFIIKTILFFNINKFEKWCKTNNDSLFCFSLTNKNVLDYVELIELLSKDKDLIKTIQVTNKYISMLDDESPIKSLSRMSIVE